MGVRFGLLCQSQIWLRTLCGLLSLSIWPEEAMHGPLSQRDEKTGPVWLNGPPDNQRWRSHLKIYQEFFFFFLGGGVPLI